MKIAVVNNKSKEEDFTDRILRRFDEDPERAKLTGLILIGLLSPIFSVILISVNYLLSPKATETDKEVNSAIGMWTLSSVLGFTTGIIMLFAISDNPLAPINLNLLRAAQITNYMQYAFMGLVALNIFRFVKGKESLYPRVLKVPLNYIKIINRFKRELT